MAFKYALDKKVIFEFEYSFRIVFRGWAIDENGNVPSFFMKINGDVYQCETSYEERSDVEELNNIQINAEARNPSSAGFIVVGNYDDNINSLELFAIRKKEIECLISLQDEELNEIKHDGKLIVSIDKCEQENELIKVNGWCLHESEVSITVENENGNTCKSAVHKTNRYDLCDCKFIDESEKLCGFELVFLKECGSEYQLIFKSDSTKIVKSMLIDEKERKGSVFGSLISNLNKDTIQVALKYLKYYGLSGLIARLKKGYEPHTQYNVWFRDNRITEYEMEKQKLVRFSYEPKISIAVPTFNTSVDMLKIMIESVLDQTYSNWELCIADASDVDNPAREVIKAYEKKYSRIKVTYLNENYGIAGNTNKAFELATGEYTGLLDHDDFLEPDALFEVVKMLNEYPYDCLYTDEDKFDTEKYKFIEPNFKPDFAIDALRSHNYITHFFIAKTELIDSLGGERNEYNGSQDYDLIFRCVEKANRVGHIAKCLYHWRIYEGSTAGNPEQKLYCYEAGKKAIEGNLERLGIRADVEMLPAPLWGLYHVRYKVKNNPLVSIIIPNYENRDVLKRCIVSLFTVNTYKNIEIIIVENNSSSKEIFDYYEEIQNEHDNVHVVNWSGKEFNYSAINNFGVSKSNGDYILLLNNDTEVISPDAIHEMLGICMRDDVGVVGAKLLYPDNTVQHAGVVIGFGGVAGHIFSRRLNNDPGYIMRAIVNYDLSAVTGACLMTKKKLYEEVNGLDENLKVAFNDVDYCLKIRSLNKMVVYNGFSKWYHFESVSRGYETDMNKIERFDSEVGLFQKKWEKVIIDGDPFYNRNLMNDKVAR